MSADPKGLPLLPLRDGVLFPRVGTPIVVGRRGSILAVERAAGGDGKIAVFAQREAEREPHGLGDLHRVGTIGEVRSVQRIDDVATVVLQGLERAVLEEVLPDGLALRARVKPAPVRLSSPSAIRGAGQEVTDLLCRLVRLHDGEPQIVHQLIDSADPVALAYAAATLLGLDARQAQTLLDMDRIDDVLDWLVDHLSHEVQSVEIRRDIAKKVAGKLGEQQREIVLREQLQRIREELGEGGAGDADLEELKKRLRETDLPPDARKEAERELRRLEQLPAMAPEYHVVRGYLDLIVELPWNRRTDARADIAAARQVLEADHHALADVKDRILEHLAVLQLNPSAKPPILCLLGPPGVGKTSLGQSIARALGRRFERLSLGGVHDESELRGHRRTYVGAMPGRIIQALRRAEVADPLIMLDEVDKLGRDFRGDPASALLEILDPEQNSTFRDNYLDLPFDLSKVLFITTCNTIETVPRPLLDRMEVVRLPGYTEEEKEQIAAGYLLPRQLENAGIDDTTFTIADDLLPFLIRRHTREAGVRQLERCLGRLVRKVALVIAEGAERKKVCITAAEAATMLGPPPHVGDMPRDHLPAGVAAGLAWTEAGGEVLYIEAAQRAGTRDLTLTGHLGEVMQESAKAALTCVWCRTEILALPADALEKVGLHVHVPSGAVPKDGPSAGVSLVTALASLMTGHPVRSDTAMTGEITITGLVLPVGGIKEKLLAARRAGLTRVILPKDNREEVEDIDARLRQDLTILFAETVEEAWSHAIPSLEVLAPPTTLRFRTRSRPDVMAPLSSRPTGQ